jgi:hypothetical protein
MPLKINGATSGSITIHAPETGTDVSMTMPPSGVAPVDSPTFTGTATFSSLTSTGLTTLAETVEILTSGTISANVFTANASNGNVFYITAAPSANFTVNVTTVPTTNDRVFSFTFFVLQGATGYIPNALQVDGSSQTIRWSSGVAPTATSGAGKIDVFNFTLIRLSSAWTVLGDVSKNY